MPQNQTSDKSKLLRKIAPAMVILVVTLGMLLWQVTIFQERQAKIRARQNTEETADYQWRTASNTERDMATKTVKAHLAALNKSDYKAAMKFQSADHQGSFRSVADFRDAMQKNYPQFDKNKAATFGLVQTGKSERILKMQISVLGRDGLHTSAIYEMIYENGQWLIAGLNGGKAAPKPKASPTSQGINQDIKKEISP